MAEGWRPATALNVHLAVVGHAWRIAVLLIIGIIASAGVSFIAA